MAELICIVCPKGCRLKVDEANDYAVTGAACERGIEYGREELLNPIRVITSTVRIEGGLHKRLPVKTDAPVPKAVIYDAMRLLDDITVKSPVRCGDVLAPKILGTDVNFVATRDM